MLRLQGHARGDLAPDLRRPGFAFQKPHKRRDPECFWAQAPRACLAAVPGTAGARPGRTSSGQSPRATTV